MKSRSKVQPLRNPPPPARRKWLFRFAALFLLPLFFLLALEEGLRLAGYGYPPELFEKTRIDGQDYLVNNEKFGLRFFPLALNRWTLPQKIAVAKSPGACRIFVFGESAAQGDPAPAFSAARYLQALLWERYPEVNCEVIDLGITAIDSHVIVPMARECAGYQADLWIIYMGNNEMIGPFGASTVFSAKAPAWPVVRLGLAIQKFRAGQLLMNIERKLKGSGGAPHVWSGLDMFLGNELAPDDPAREVVYQNYQRNLRDILRAGLDSGANVLLSTVAVNLKDCPPFASLHSRALPAADREKSDHWLADGRQAQGRNDWKTAAADFAQAITVDPKLAEAQFREGQCLLQLNDLTHAALHFQNACDCDGLVFRADARLNGIIRDTAQKLAGPKLALCDAAAALPEPGAIAGDETFYEHVHLNFDGNYRLGLLWAEQAERLLPESVQDKAKGGWASQQTCENRLGLTDWNRTDILHGEVMRMENAPLNSQFNNGQRKAALMARIQSLFQERSRATAESAKALYLEAISRAPKDYMLRENYAEFLELTGKFKRAAGQLKEASELMPSDVYAFITEGKDLEHGGDFASAKESFEHALKLRPRDAGGWFELGKLDTLQKNFSNALENYHRAAELQPNDEQTYLYLGETLAQMKRIDESVQNLRHALELHPDYLEAHYALGEVMGLQGNFEEARQEFQQVVRLQPGFAKGHLNLGVALLKLNNREDAREQFAETLRLDPDNQAARAYLSALSK